MKERILTARACYDVVWRAGSVTVYELGYNIERPIARFPYLDNPKRADNPRAEIMRVIVDAIDQGYAAGHEAGRAEAFDAVLELVDKAKGKK